MRSLPPRPWRSPRLAPLLAVVLGPCLAEPPAPYRPGSELAGRQARWSLKATDLNRTIEFYKTVLGMRVLKHTEHRVPSAVTRNGPYDTAWSSTLMGFETLQVLYRIELIYNYGVSSYVTGETLRAIALRSPIPMQQARDAAQLMGYQSFLDGAFQLLLEQGHNESTTGYKIQVYGDQSVLVMGPDNYRYLLLPDLPGSVEPMDHFMLLVRDVRASVDFYTRFFGLGMHTETAIVQGAMLGRLRDIIQVIGYSPTGGLNASGVPMLFHASLDEAPVRVTPWVGRMWISLPASMFRLIYTWFHLYAKGRVLHVMQYMPSDETPNKILTAVVLDPDGNEVQLVSDEFFDLMVFPDPPASEPNWTLRQELEQQYSTRIVPDPPLEPLCELYKCPFTFPDPRPPQPPWHSWPEQHYEQVQLGLAPP